MLIYEVTIDVLNLFYRLKSKSKRNINQNYIHQVLIYQKINDNNNNMHNNDRHINCTNKKQINNKLVFKTHLIDLQSHLHKFQLLKKLQQTNQLVKNSNQQTQDTQSTTVKSNEKDQLCQQVLNNSYVYFYKPDQLQNFQINLTLFIRRKEQTQSVQQNQKIKFLGQTSLRLTIQDIADIKQQKQQFKNTMFVKKTYLQHSKDQSSYLNAIINVRLLKQFINLNQQSKSNKCLKPIQSKQNIRLTSQSQQNMVTSNQLKQNLMITSQSKFSIKEKLLEQEIAKLQNRQKAYTRQIDNLLLQKKELQKELRLKKQLFLTNKNLRSDKLKILQKRCLKVSSQYMQIKQQLAQILNHANEKGNNQLIFIIQGIINKDQQQITLNEQL